MANKITVTSLGTTANVNATPDSARYYSDKSKEWAISEKLIDNTDYSSKYYANESKKQADISTAKVTEVIASGNTAVSNIESARDNAITDINIAGATQVALATEQATIATNKTSEVVASGNTALSNIDTAKSGALTDITNLKNTSVSNITTVKNNAITSLTTQETTSKNNVIATGNAQVERVNLTGVDNRTPIFSKSEVRTNEGVYQNVYDLKHSTFDLSKFTVVGSPTITDDGIASGFKEGISVNIPITITSNKFTIEGEFTFGENLTTFQFACEVFSPAIKRYIISIRPISDNYLSVCYWNGTGTEVVFYSQTEVPRIANKSYKYKIEIDGTTAKSTINGITKTTNKFVFSDVTKIVIGNNYKINGTFSGSIDLSQFSITVDGKEVFNGNKTGLDVIKPDNYTVVGSPVISDDGVASGFSSSNRIETNFPTSKLSIANTFKIRIPFTTSSTMAQGNLFSCNSIDGGTIGYSIVFIIANANGDIYCFLGSTGTGWDIQNGTTGIKVQANKSYIGEIEFTGNSYIIKVIDLEDNSIVGQKIVNSSLKVASLSNTFKLGASNVWSPFNGSIDLNAFKIYVDGNLVYQPCLKIPYTQSKTDSKIVDVAYRDRVIDLYEQEGQAGYYTIDEENKNFTLPMGEIYGMIGQRSLISSTVTETNRVDIYSDKTCLICGNIATAGTINLPIELMNNNYFITLSTSAKTATSFTTTAIGDYILIGKVA